MMVIVRIVLRIIYEHDFSSIVQKSTQESLKNSANRHRPIILA